MGSVTGARCDRWHGLLAMRAVGQIEAEDEVALEAHLDGCAECRDEATDLAEVSVALPYADPSRFVSDDVPPPDLADAVLGRLHHDAEGEVRRTTVRRRLRWAGGGAAIGAVAAALILVLVVGMTPSHAPSDRTVALHGPAGVHASVVIAPTQWGSEVRLTESGQAPGQVMWLSMGTGENGTKWVGGSYRTVANGTVRASFPCALSANSIDHVWVHDASGRTVMWSGYTA
jgi:anti-sigma factor RsiW